VLYCTMKSLPRAATPGVAESDIVIPAAGLKGFAGLVGTDRAAHEEILHRAHSIWVCDGRPQGRELAHWLKAEAEVLSER
jgi:hypothetical protein